MEFTHHRPLLSWMLTIPSRHNDSQPQRHWFTAFYTPENQSAIWHHHPAYDNDGADRCWSNRCTRIKKFIAIFSALHNIKSQPYPTYHKDVGQPEPLIFPCSQPFQVPHDWATLSKTIVNTQSFPPYYKDACSNTCSKGSTGINISILRVLHWATRGQMYAICCVEYVKNAKSIIHNQFSWPMSCLIN